MHKNEVNMLSHTKAPTDTMIIAFLKNSGYAMDIPGICFGLANMAMRAIVLGGNHLDEFKSTLSLLDRYMAQQEPRIEDIEKMVIIKGEPPTGENTNTVYIQIENNKKLTAHYPGGFKKSTEHPALTAHLASYVENSAHHQLDGMSAMGVLGKFAKIPASAITLNDMPASKDKEKITELFNNILKFQKAQKQDEYQLALAHPIDNETLTLVDTTSSAYTVSELKTFLKILKEEAEKPGCPSFSFSLSMKFHSIMIGYDANKKEWYCMNSNKSISKNIRPIDFNDIFPKIAKTFQCSKWYTPITQFVCNEKTSHATYELLARIKEREEWKKIQEITDEKILAENMESPGYTLLLCEIRESNIPAIKAILQSKHIKDIINKPYCDPHNGVVFTPMSMAIMIGDVEVVKMLLATNLIDDKEKIYLIKNVQLDLLGCCDRYCSSPNHDEIFQLLLEYRNNKENMSQAQSSSSAYTKNTNDPLEAAVSEIIAIIKTINIHTCSDDEETRGLIGNILDNMTASLSNPQTNVVQKLEFSRRLFDNLNRNLKQIAAYNDAGSTSMFTPSITSKEYQNDFGKISAVYDRCAHLLQTKQPNM